MTTKATLHQSIEGLPESELVAAERFLAYLRDMVDSVRRALLTAPWDDEPETEEGAPGRARSPRRAGTRGGDSRSRPLEET